MAVHLQFVQLAFRRIAVAKAAFQATRSFHSNAPIQSSSLRNGSDQPARPSVKKDRATMTESGLLVKIGLEVHTLLRSKRKLFSRAPGEGAQSPLLVAANTQLSLFDVAVPGAQPRLNAECVLLAVLAGLAFNCEIASKLAFDRKHYFYRDLPAGYQITQKYHPIAQNGSLRVSQRDDDDIKEDINIPITHIQLEQDTAASIYDPDSPEVLLDFNRAGMPLLEIVTGPVTMSAEAAGAILHKIQTIARLAGISDGRMEAGGMRCDANVSVETTSGTEFVKIHSEIKNVASVRNLVAAIKYEINRQKDLVSRGISEPRSTRGFNDDTGETFLARVKDSGAEYRYIPENDVPTHAIASEVVERARKMLPPLIDERMDLLLGEKFEFSLKVARTLVHNDKAFRLLIDTLETPDDHKQPAKQIAKQIANWILHDYAGALMTADRSWEESDLNAEQLADILKMVWTEQISQESGRQMLAWIATGEETDVAVAIEKHSLRLQKRSADDVDALISRCICANTARLESPKMTPKMKRTFMIGVIRREDPHVNFREIQERLAKRFAD